MVKGLTAAVATLAPALPVALAATRTQVSPKQRVDLETGPMLGDDGAGGPDDAARRGPRDRVVAWSPAAARHLYAASREEAPGAIAPSPRVGHLYMTSGTLPGPCGTVPDHLPKELAAIGGCR